MNKNVSTKKTKRITKKSSALSKFPFKKAIFCVLKQVHPLLGISPKSLDIVNEFIHEAFYKIYRESAKMIKFKGKRSLTIKELNLALGLVLP